MAPFTRIQTSNGDVNRLQDSVVTAINPLQAAPLTGGAMLTNVSLIAGNNVIPHGLQRTPTYFIVSYINANITTPGAYQAFDSNNIYISVSSPCIVSFWVN